MGTLQKTIKINPNELAKINKFVDNRMNECKKLYQKRGGIKREDFLVGAFAEQAVYKFLRAQNIRVQKPDFKIYESSKKSYAGDLTDGNKTFHVKGQSLDSAQKYGNSWLMQKNDPLVRTEDLNKVRNHYLVPCTVDISNKEVTIRGLYSFTYLHKNAVFKACKVNWFNMTKVAIYGEDLNKKIAFRLFWNKI